MAPERAATLAELRAVREAMDELSAVMARQVEAKVVEVAVPREEFTRRVRASGKRTVAGMLILLLLIILAVGANRLTLLQAQRQAERDLRHLIQVCRTTTPAISPADMRFCEARIPGFARARANATRQVQQARRLDDLQKWAQSKGWEPPP